MSDLPGFMQTALFGAVVETALGAWDPQTGGATKLNAAFLPWFSASGDPLPAKLRREEIFSGKRQPTVWDLLYYTAISKTTGSAKEELPPKKRSSKKPVRAACARSWMAF